MTVSITVSLPNISKPVIDRATGMCDSEWYQFFEKLMLRTGGISGSDFIAGAINDITEINAALSTKADKTITLIAGNGLTGGGDLSANRTFTAKQNTGWTHPTGSGAKGAYTQYAGQTVSIAYIQAEAQTTDDAVKAMSARMIALELAIRANGGID